MSKISAIKSFIITKIPQQLSEKKIAKYVEMSYELPEEIVQTRGMIANYLKPSRKYKADIFTLSNNEKILENVADIQDNSHTDGFIVEITNKRNKKKVFDIIYNENKDDIPLSRKVYKSVQVLMDFLQNNKT